MESEFTQLVGDPEELLFLDPSHEVVDLGPKVYLETLLSRPIRLYDTWQTGIIVPRCVWCCNSPLEVGVFMWGREIENFGLFVNERSYSWGSLTDEHNIDEVVRHVAYCLDLEASFNDSEACLKALQEYKRESD